MTTALGIRGRRAIRIVGHSARSIDAFLDLLRAQGIKRMMDVRTIPRSRHTPQFNRAWIGLDVGMGIDPNLKLIALTVLADQVRELI